MDMDRKNSKQLLHDFLRNGNQFKAFDNYFQDLEQVKKKKIHKQASDYSIKYSDQQYSFQPFRQERTLQGKLLMAKEDKQLTQTSDATPTAIYRSYNSSMERFNKRKQHFFVKKNVQHTGMFNIEQKLLLDKSHRVALQESVKKKINLQDTSASTTNKSGILSILQISAGGAQTPDHPKVSTHQPFNEEYYKTAPHQKTPARDEESMDGTQQSNGCSYEFLRRKSKDYLYFDRFSNSNLEAVVTLNKVQKKVFKSDKDMEQQFSDEYAQYIIQLNNLIQQQRQAEQNHERSDMKIASEKLKIKKQRIDLIKAQQVQHRESLPHKFKQMNSLLINKSQMETPPVGFYLPNYHMVSKAMKACNIAQHGDRQGWLPELSQTQAQTWQETGLGEGNMNQQHRRSIDHQLEQMTFEWSFGNLMKQIKSQVHLQKLQSQGELLHPNQHLQLHIVPNNVEEIRNVAKNMKEYLQNQKNQMSNLKKNYNWRYLEHP